MSIPKYNGLKKRRKVDALLTISAFALAASLFMVSAAPARAAVYSVAISDNNPHLFTPQVLTINVGDTVTWTCNDGAHTTSSNAGQAESWASPTLNEGGTFTWTFTHAGNFSYVSTASGDSGEVGYIVVQQPTPEFPGYVLFITVASAIVLALLVERRLR